MRGLRLKLSALTSESPLRGAQRAPGVKNSWSLVTPTKKDACLTARVRWFGGAEEDRTPDLNTASVALSQLSYSPMRPPGRANVVVVEVRRLELLTSTVRLSRSPS